MAKVFGDRNEWSSSSARYYLQEHRAAGDGLRGLVYKSLFDKREDTDFSDLSGEEMHYHLHVAKVHQGMTGSKSTDVCEMPGHAVDKSGEKGLTATKAMEASYEGSMRSVLSNHCSNSTQLESLVQDVQTTVKENTQKTLHRCK